MYVNTRTGGAIDIGRSFAGNRNGGNLLAGSSSSAVIPLGMDTLSAPPPALTLHQSARQPILGEWFRVADDSIVGRSSVFDSSLGLYHVWSPPRGASIRLNRGEFRGHGSIWNVFREDHFTYTDCYVQFTANTAPGLAALGLIPDSSVPRPVGGGGRPATTQDAIVGGSRALIVLAVVGAAIYFLPHNLFKGSA